MTLLPHFERYVAIAAANGRAAPSVAAAVKAPVAVTMRYSGPTMMCVSMAPPPVVVPTVRPV